MDSKLQEILQKASHNFVTTEVFSDNYDDSSNLSEILDIVKDAGFDVAFVSEPNEPTRLYYEVIAEYLITDGTLTTKDLLDENIVDKAVVRYAAELQKLTGNKVIISKFGQSLTRLQYNHIYREFIKPKEDENTSSK